MLDATIRRLIALRLSNSQVKQIVADEMVRMCSLKPPGLSFDAYCQEVVHILLSELQEQVADVCTGECDNGDSPAESITVREAGQPGTPMDFDKIIDGLMHAFRRDLLFSHMDMIGALGSAIAERDTGTNDHNFRVTIAAVLLAEAHGLENEQIRSLMKGSFLHDVGKIGIPDAIMIKPGKLASDERHIMDSHVERGAYIVRGAHWLDDARDVILYHHEKWDGSGYVAGLAGDKIPLNARLFAVVDVFDALTSERPYKPALSLDRAMKTMRDESGSHFDPELLNSFMGIGEEIHREVVESPSPELELRLKNLTRKYFSPKKTVK
ncbi:MAG: HD-GYP domain-containing protein [candidate division Zixibacteria bacterium]|nr:HD-GYP domain-containing protein [candidate division Zixibacteria bacterium]